MAQNKAGTLWYDAEKLLTETLEFLGHKNATVHDTGLKILIELEDGRRLFFLYASNLPETQMQGHVLAWLMSEASES